MRKAGECWRCGDKWIPGHKCKLVPNVHLMQQEEVEQDTMAEESMEQEQEEMVEEGEQVMFMSAHALGHQLALPSPTVMLYINWYCFVALLDSGCTTSFINEYFVVKANCQLLPVNREL